MPWLIFAKWFLYLSVGLSSCKEDVLSTMTLM